jgi:hypothetical protein
MKVIFNILKKRMIKYEEGNRMGLKCKNTNLHKELHLIE